LALRKLISIIKLQDFLPEKTRKSEFRYYASSETTLRRRDFAVSIGNWKFKREGFTVDKVMIHSNKVMK